MSKRNKQEQNERTQRRVRNAYSQNIDSEFFPEKQVPGYYDNDVYLRIAIYVRVSTDDPRQASSYELQKAYYEDFVRKHPKWELVEIYADDGISGTSLKHRDSFLKMIADCKQKKIDLIITKSVSRFARNVEDFMGTIHMLSDMRPPVGVFFETENLSSLNDDTSLGLSFQATMAEEESHNKSRSMETSLRMRLDHGLPLTPELLGFNKNEDGKLIVNQETAHIPKLMFYMYLFGYSTQQIADALTYLEKKTYLGNTKWTAGGIARIMRNERYCGDVFTRKTFTQSYRTHLSIKNRGERPRTLYHNEHESIVSRDDFIAVQHMLNNAKYGNKSILPELRVIPDGLLKGFVIINPRWANFNAKTYHVASAGAYSVDSDERQSNHMAVESGSFDLREYVIAHSSLFNDMQMPCVSLSDDGLTFNSSCVQKMATEMVELLIHPTKQLFAVRAAKKDSRNAVVWAKFQRGAYKSKRISGAAFMGTLFQIFGWNTQYRYKMFSTFLKDNDQRVMIFKAAEASALIPTDITPLSINETGGKPIPAVTSGQRMVGIPLLPDQFGNSFYEEQSFSALASQTKADWKIRIEGELVKTGMQLQVTDFETLKDFISKHLGDWTPEENKQ